LRCMSTPDEFQVFFWMIECSERHWKRRSFRM